MFSLATLTFPTPITLTIHRRPQPPGFAGPSLPVGVGTPREFRTFSVCFRINPVTKTIHAEMPPLPRPILIYGAADFSAAASDTPEQHAERLMQILGTDPATVLQAIIDHGTAPAIPPRVPREIPNWRCKAVLLQMGLLHTVEAIFATLPEPDQTIALLAWRGDGKVARQGRTVLGLASALGLTAEQVDDMFLEAEGIDV
jgi:hypothetical protein